MTFPPTPTSRSGYEDNPYAIHGTPGSFANGPLVFATSPFANGSQHHPTAVAAAPPNGQSQPTAQGFFLSNYFTQKVFILATNESEQKDFLDSLESSSGRKDFVHVGHSICTIDENIRKDKDLLEHAIQALELDHQRKLAVLKAGFGTLQKAESILQSSKSIYAEAHLIVNGSSSTGRPEDIKVTEALLDRICRAGRIDMKVDCPASIAKKLFVGSWLDVEKLTKHEGQLVLKCLTTNGFTENPHFRSNIEHYKTQGVIPKDFNNKQILCQTRFGAPTIHGLIGIYMHLLPPNIGRFTHMHNNSSPWSSSGGVDALHDANNSGVTVSVASYDRDSFGVPAPKNVFDFSNTSGFNVGNVEMVASAPASAGGFSATSGFNLANVKTDGSAPASSGGFFGAPYNNSAFPGPTAAVCSMSSALTTASPANASDQRKKKRLRPDGDHAPASKKANYGI